MAIAQILVGSKSDLPYLRRSSLIERLEEAGVGYAISVCSAHRNAGKLRERIDRTIDDTAVWVCGAGMAAALPGAVKAELLGRSFATVFGIALPSKGFEDARDAMHGITRLPPGIAVIFAGVGADAFTSIADSVIELVRAYKPPEPKALEAALAEIKAPYFDIDPREI